MTDLSQDEINILTALLREKLAYIHEELRDNDPPITVAEAMTKLAEVPEIKLLAKLDPQEHAELINYVQTDLNDYLTPSHPDQTIYIWIGQDRRDILIHLALTGFTTVEEARNAITSNLLTKGCDGDSAGKVTRVSELQDSLDIETENCRFGISNTDIQRAINAKGSTVFI